MPWVNHVKLIPKKINAKHLTSKTAAFSWKVPAFAPVVA